MSEWQWLVWNIIPVSRLGVATVAIRKIWGNPDYGSIRLSATGVEPATHLLLRVPSVASEAKLVKETGELPGDDHPDFPDVSPSAPDRALFRAMRAGKSDYVMAITDRLTEDNKMIRANWAVQYIDSRYDHITTITSLTDFLSILGLQVILQRQPEE